MRLAYKAGYPDYNLRRVQSLPLGLHGKYTYEDGIAEVLATMFVRANTTIPVPDILDVIELPRDTFIIMNTLPGKHLGGGLEHMDAAGVAAFVDDLRGWLHQLRSLVPPPGTSVGSVLGTPSTQFRISTSDPIGPYRTIDELHQDILNRFIEPEAADQVVRKSYSKRHRLCFTHCDLNSRNVLMHNGRLSGLVDFGSSGWFPEYWEYGASSWGFTYYYPQWVEGLHKIFPQYRDEYEAEEILWDQINPH
ncbi:hypothetical protein PsYK624_159350 [Phanerochaete sordida]|uniref:Aminoglycoside phosphotransferase domain-containing protein n=1 Tax=Phanerochaete sordida TaxID=48140 RepID=A0A9P3GUD9_9APHY|nr:hypothetical protein PsYK624_159350 [Phanerochaete sordida]